MKSVSKSEEGPVVSEAQVAAFRLARHHLATPAPKASIARVVGDMGGAQAQIMSAAALSLRARIRGLRPEDVEKALWRGPTPPGGGGARGAGPPRPPPSTRGGARGGGGPPDPRPPMCGAPRARP